MATFCLIHGAWHDPSCWDPVAVGLRAQGHEVVAPDLPLHDPSSGFEQRARPAIEALGGAHEPVVVVGHSMASAYALLVAVAHPTALIVHLCPRLGGLTPPPGAPDTFRAAFPFPPERPDGTSAWDPEAAVIAMYSRLPPESALGLVRNLRPMAQPPGEFPLSSHPAIRTALVYAAEDEFFEPAWERFMARELLGVDPIEIPTGHFPMAEDPDALSDLLDRLATEAVGGEGHDPPTSRL